MSPFMVDSFGTDARFCSTSKKGSPIPCFPGPARHSGTLDTVNKMPRQAVHVSSMRVFSRVSISTSDLLTPRVAVRVFYFTENGVGTVPVVVGVQGVIASAADITIFLEIFCTPIFFCVLRMCVTRSRDAVATLSAQICCSTARSSRQQSFCSRKS